MKRFPFTPAETSKNIHKRKKIHFLNVLIVFRKEDFHDGKFLLYLLIYFLVWFKRKEVKNEIQTKSFSWRTESQYPLYWWMRQKRFRNAGY